MNGQIPENWADQGHVNLLEIVMRMREERHPSMVEGREQYQSCYAILTELMKRSCSSIRDS